MQCVLVVLNQTTTNMCCVQPRRAKTSSALWRKPAISHTVHLIIELHFGLAVCLEVVYLIWHVSVFCSGVMVPCTDVSNCMSILSQETIASTKHQRTDRGKIYFVRDYFVCCPLACINFPKVGIDCLYMDTYDFGQTCYYRIII